MANLPLSTHRHRMRSEVVREIKSQPFTTPTSARPSGGRRSPRPVVVLLSRAESDRLISKSIDRRGDWMASEPTATLVGPRPSLVHRSSLSIQQSANCDLSLQGSRAITQLIWPNVCRIGQNRLRWVLPSGEGAPAKLPSMARPWLAQASSDDPPLIQASHENHRHDDEQDVTAEGDLQRTPDIWTSFAAVASATA